MIKQISVKPAESKSASVLKIHYSNYSNFQAGRKKLRSQGYSISISPAQMTVTVLLRQ